ncbi:unnamed protein product [Plutella xylostella]|uniref:(diamondback moth) hypothetical protein n=1 Tax=Plutella xylostella TaxID=51655 RepID=A0A8S4G1T2_PLUXY|nr:unnamed protein product [Plutella xylostella]
MSKGVASRCRNGFQLSLVLWSRQVSPPWAASQCSLCLRANVGVYLVPHRISAMHPLVQLLAAAALLSQVSAAITNRKIKDIPVNLDVDNSIDANDVPSKRLGVKRFVRITTRPPPALNLTGASLELTCEAMGSPAPSIQWLRDHVPVAESFVRITTRPPPALNLTSASLELTCEAMGSPAPSIQWLRDHVPVAESFVRITTRPPPALNLTGASLELTCEAMGSLARS